MTTVTLSAEFVVPGRNVASILRRHKDFSVNVGQRSSENHVKRPLQCRAGDEGNWAIWNEHATRRPGSGSPDAGGRRAH